MFETEEVAGIRGLTSLTEPGARDRVGAVVDVAVIGARGDGKTQFIVHAIRTLRAYAPVLAGAEQQFNRDVLQVVMNAREPRPDATVPGVVPHYVFRIRPDTLLAQVGLGRRLGLLRRAAGLGSLALLALLNAGLLAAALWVLRGMWDAAATGGVAGAAALGLIASALVARQRFVRGGEIEIVFWDVAGEHIYSDSAVDYYSFLSALVRERERRATPDRRYAFAPVLMCNPLALGARHEGSSYARLRQLIPLFATLGGPAPRAMVAINRWAVVEKVCAPDSDRDELVALLPRARAADEEEAPEPDEAVDTNRLTPVEPLPIVRRDVLRRHCLDAEDASDLDVAFTYLRYDAGMQCELHETAWEGFDALPAGARLRWRAPSSSGPARVLEYVYEDGPGSFDGETRKQLLAWLAGMAFDRRRRYLRPEEPAPELDAPEPAPVADDERTTTARPPLAARAPAGGSISGFATRTEGADRSSPTRADHRSDDVDEVVELWRRASTAVPVAAAPEATAPEPAGPHDALDGAAPLDGPLLHLSVGTPATAVDEPEAPAQPLHRLRLDAGDTGGAGALGSERDERDEAAESSDAPHGAVARPPSHEELAALWGARAGKGRKTLRGLAQAIDDAIPDEDDRRVWADAPAPARAETTGDDAWTGERTSPGVGPDVGTRRAPTDAPDAGKASGFRTGGT